VKVLVGKEPSLERSKTAAIVAADHHERTKQRERYRKDKKEIGENPFALSHRTQVGLRTPSTRQCRPGNLLELPVRARVPAKPETPIFPRLFLVRPERAVIRVKGERTLLLLATLLFSLGTRSLLGRDPSGGPNSPF
jgi:hypothetical protein